MLQKLYYQLQYLLGFISKNDYKQKKHLYLNKKKIQKKYIKYKANNFIESYFTLHNEDDFVPISDTFIDKKDRDPLLLAYYLTQFHETEINNENFGKGFTEWTNVAKAKQLYQGHYQPQIPIDVGFYDLSHDDVMYRQIELAKQYGIGGFCFYYYWFQGKRVLEKPLFNFLNNEKLDIPFCLFWANETWQRRWFGGKKEILIEHKFDLSMINDFFYDILPFFKDKRYIKINNKPFFIIYHHDEFTSTDLRKIIKEFDTLAKENGFNGIHFVGQGYKLPNEVVEEYGLNAVAEFSPCGMNIPEVTSYDGWTVPNFEGYMFDTSKFLINEKWKYDVNYTLYKGVFTNWDNTPRSHINARIYRYMTPKTYKDWLKKVISYTKTNNSKDHQIIFINAWNEWGEGAHLEPDIKYGYAYLQATKEAIEESRGSV